MTGIIRYFTSIIATAILGVITSSMITDPRISRLVRTVTGVLVLLVLLRPLLHTDLEELGSKMQGMLNEEQITQDYKALYDKKLREQIMITTENYILEKATSIGAEIQVEVELDPAPYPTPHIVVITGNVTPEQKEILSDYLTHQLNIDPGNQRWNVHD